MGKKKHSKLKNLIGLKLALSSTKYLGLPLIMGRTTNAIFQKLVDKFETKLEE